MVSIVLKNTQSSSGNHYYIIAGKTHFKIFLYLGNGNPGFPDEGGGGGGGFGFSASEAGKIKYVTCKYHNYTCFLMN